MTHEPSLDVYIFDTKKNNEKSLTKLGPCLNAPKYNPNVVVIQGKIYVFPTSFAKEVSSPRFEVFDSLEGTWTSLPDPDWDSCSPNTEKWIPYPHKFRVISHLVEVSKLILSTPEVIHIFDVTKPHAGWKHVHRYRGASLDDIPRDSVLADNDNMCFTTDYFNTKFTAYNLSKDDAFANPLCVLKSYRNKLVGPVYDYYEKMCGKSYLASLRDDGENSRICHVRSSSKQYDRFEYIVIKVYAFEKGYGKKKEEHKHRQ